MECFHPELELICHKIGFLGNGLVYDIVFTVFGILDIDFIVQCIVVLFGVI